MKATTQRIIPSLSIVRCHERLKVNNFMLQWWNHKNIYYKG